MKTFRSFILLAVAGCTLNASAEIYTVNFNSGFANGGVIPDGNTTGWFDTRTLSGLDASPITDVNVSLNIIGGYNGDLYAYLTHDSGISILLNRVGRTSGNPFGYSDSGLNLTFDDSAGIGDIHTYQAVTSYSTLIGNGSVWAPDGRNVSPLLSLDTSSRTSLLSLFNGLDANGGWTLFVADLSGGGQGAVTSWGLNITTVPEPSALSLAAAAAIILMQKKFRR